MIKAVRVFYRISDNQIVWTRELRGAGVFSTTLEQNLAEIPDKPQLDDKGSVILDVNENFIKSGGVPEDYACIEETDPQRASDFLASDENTIVDEKLIIGTKRITPEPIPPRDLASEIDELKAEIEGLKTR